MEEVLGYLERTNAVARQAGGQICLLCTSITHQVKDVIYIGVTRSNRDCERKRVMDFGLPDSVTT